MQEAQRKVYGMKKMIIPGFSAFISVLVMACAPPVLRIEPAPAPPIKQKPLNAQTIGGKALSGLDIRSPGAVMKMIFFPENRQLFIEQCKNPEEKCKEQYLTLLDTDSNRCRWNYISNASLVSLRDKYMILTGYGTKLFEAQTGRYLEDVTASTILLGEDKAISFYQQRWKFRDIANKRTISKNLDNWRGYLWTLLQDNCLYVVGEGLQSFNFTDTTSWTLRTSTYSVGHGKALAMAALGAFATGITGAYCYQPYSPNTTHNISSRPLPIGKEVYFAARKRILCLDRKSGQIKWERELSHELGVMEWEALDDSLVVLIGKGYKYVDFVEKQAAPPCLIIFNRHKGDIVFDYQISDDEILLDHKRVRDTYYMLTQNKIESCNIRTGVVHTQKADKKAEHYLDIIDIGSDLYVRSETGVLQLDPTTLEQKSNLVLGLVPVSDDTIKFSQKPRYIYLRDAMRKHSWLGGDLYFTCSDSDIHIIDLPTMTKKDRFGSNFEYMTIQPNGTMVIQQGAFIRIIYLDALRY